MELFSFLAGVVTGTFLVIAWGYIQLIRLNKAKNSIIKTIKDKAEALESKKESIKNRLIEAADIARTQQEIKARVEMPSKNSLDSKYKNSLISELRDLEQQKLAVLKSILDDGFDPKITVVNEAGVREEISLSAYLAYNMEDGKNDEEIPPPPPSTETSKRSIGNPRVVGKFTVYDGGSDWEDNNDNGRNN